MFAGAIALGLGFGGAAWALDRLTFDVPGAPDALSKTLRGASLLVSAQDAGNTGAQDLFAAARADYGRILAALYAEGYYSGVIHIYLDGREAASIAPLNAPARIGTVRVTVDPGPPFTFGQARIAPLAVKTTLPKEFALGQPAKSGVLQQAVDAAVTGWRAAGHAKATTASQRVTANHPKAQLNADIAMAPGPRVTFGNLIVTGTSRVREASIRKIAGFPTGKVFDPKAEEKAATRLRRSGAFRSVALTEADTLGPGNTLDVTAALVDEKRRRLGFGAQIASLDGLTVSGYWMHRNLFGGAERFRIEGEVSGIGAQTGGIDYRFSARLDKPAVVNADSALYILGTVERLNETDYDEDLILTEIGLTRVLGDHLSARAGVGLRISKVTDQTGVTNFHQITFPIGVTFDTRDTALDAHRGVYVDASVTPFLGFSGSASGGQIKLDARSYKRLGERVVLAGRLQLGSVVGASVAETPPDYLFYSGGGGTVRGQPYQSLGVYVISPTQRSGGRSFLGLSGEVRGKVSQSIGVVAFYDAGYVSAGSFSDQNGAWQAGAGIGLRYYTGIGPIRLDIATPVAGGTGKGVQVYIGIGQAF